MQQAVLSPFGRLLRSWGATYLPRRDPSVERGGPGQAVSAVVWCASPAL